jgi:hypothetical protein
VETAYKKAEMKYFLTIIVFHCFLIATYAQDRSSFCRAVEKGKFKKVERLFNLEVKKRKWGKTYDNGPGSGMQVTHTYDLDTLTTWLKSKPCVADAAWDKCQIKALNYPGWSVIGAKFITHEGIKEKCFYLKEGTMGTVRIFGWRPHLFKARNKLILKKMYDCNGFIELQRNNCDQYH